MMPYNTVPNTVVFIAVDVTTASTDCMPVHYRDWQLNIKVRAPWLACTQKTCATVKAAAEFLFIYELLSVACCLEEGWNREYRCYLQWGKSSCQSCRLLYAAWWAHQCPPQPGCTPVQILRTHTGWSPQSDRTEEWRGTTERGGDSGRGGVELITTSWLESKRHRNISEKDKG